MEFWDEGGGSMGLEWLTNVVLTQTRMGLGNFSTEIPALLCVAPGPLRRLQLCSEHLWVLRATILVSETGRCPVPDGTKMGV